MAVHVDKTFTRASTQVFAELGLKAPTAVPGVNKAQLIEDVRAALYASKICSYAQVRLQGCSFS